MSTFSLCSSRPIKRDVFPPICQADISFPSSSNSNSSCIPRPFPLFFCLPDRESVTASSKNARNTIPQTAVSVSRPQLFYILVKHRNIIAADSLHIIISMKFFLFIFTSIYPQICSHKVKPSFSVFKSHITLK